MATVRILCCRATGSSLAFGLVRLKMFDFRYRGPIARLAIQIRDRRVDELLVQIIKSSDVE